MSTKSRKAIPLKEDIVQPTSLDFDKLYDALNSIIRQVAQASDQAVADMDLLEKKSNVLLTVLDALQDASSAITRLD